MAMPFEYYRFQRAFEAERGRKSGHVFYWFRAVPVHPSVRA
jgi:hypothetical protein